MTTSPLTRREATTSVLVIDDEPAVCELFARVLHDFGYEVTTETNSTRIMELLRSQRFQVVLLDLVMPEIGGVTLLREIRNEFSTLPVIIVTGYGSLENAVAAMRAGAADFVSKPVDGPVLDLRIQKALELEYTRRLANTDGLTGLYNHRYFQERLQEEINRARRYSHPLSLVLADIDDFKRFNDTYGHPCGDRALLEVARVLARVSRNSDIVARYGGEEFAVLLPETTKPQAEICADRIRTSVWSHRFRGPDDQERLRLSLSAGVAVFLPEGNAAHLLQRADVALYQAKRLGRNRVCAAE
jgi:diguanylate cyclase (GGDEF)-like protein